MMEWFVVSDNRISKILPRVRHRPRYRQTRSSRCDPYPSVKATAARLSDSGQPCATWVSAPLPRRQKPPSPCRSSDRRRTHQARSGHILPDLARPSSEALDWIPGFPIRGWALTDSFIIKLPGKKRKKWQNYTIDPQEELLSVSIQAKREISPYIYSQLYLSFFLSSRSLPVQKDFIKKEVMKIFKRERDPRALR